VLRGLRIFDEPDLIPEIVHPEWLNHEGGGPNRHGREGAYGTVRLLTGAFADLHYEVHRMVAEDDLVAVHLTMSGRHVGSFAGMEPTGASFAAPHVHLYRVADGLLREHWAVRDDLRMMRQLGAA
jgi:predicted ester cyclase